MPLRWTTGGQTGQILRRSQNRNCEKTVRHNEKPNGGFERLAKIVLKRDTSEFNSCFLAEVEVTM